jgi:hypothetical protein
MRRQCTGAERRSRDWRPAPDGKHEEEAWRVYRLRKGNVTYNQLEQQHVTAVEPTGFA